MKTIDSYDTGLKLILIRLGFLRKHVKIQKILVKNGSLITKEVRLENGMETKNIFLTLKIMVLNLRILKKQMSQIESFNLMNQYLGQEYLAQK